MVNRYRLLVACASLLALSAACGDDTNQPPAGGGGAGGGAQGGQGEGGESCEDTGGRCVEVPAGFEGPVQLSDNVAQCTSLAFDGGFGEASLTLTDAECQCACTSDDAACAISGNAYADQACASLSSAPFAVSDGVCAAVPQVLGGPALSVELTAGAATATCASDGVAANLPPAPFEPRALGCNINLDACDATTTCIPGIRTYCIYSTTETTCPVGFDVENTLFQAADLEDTRDCTCGCGDATATCAPAFVSYADGACATQAAPSSLDCEGVPTGIGSIMPTAGATATCEPATETVSGSVAIVGSGMLVCCTP